jgi:hypothetical protein
MVLHWLLSGLLVMAGGFGVLQSAVSMENYVLLATGIAMFAFGMVLMTRDHSVRQP